jgi:DNA-binding NarL/FixJ family response regulator
MQPLEENRTKSVLNDISRVFLTLLQTHIFCNPIPTLVCHTRGMKNRILLVTANSDFAAQIHLLVAGTSDLELIADLQPSRELLEAVNRLSPDAVVIDDPSCDLEFLQRLSHDVSVLVISNKKDDSSIFGALQAGARGYILNPVAPDVLLRALRAVAHGEALFSQAVAERLSTFFTTLPSRVPELFLELTPREREVMRLLLHRFSSKDMARRLELRPKTIRNHVSSIVSKLQVKNRIEAVELATEQGFQ